MNKTKIEWVKNPDGSQGFTWNPLTGCLNHVDGMCKGGGFPCYAYRLAHGRLRKRYLENQYFGDYSYQKLIDPFYPRFWPGRLNQPIWFPYNFRYRHPRAKGIFVCDMSDLFGIGIPEQWTERVMEAIRACPHHRFYLLTKQPQNLPKWSPFPDNCWVGVTATNKAMVTLAQFHLYEVEAKVKFISFEPLLEYIPEHRLTFKGMGNRIDWLIIGAQTRPYKPPKIEWLEEIIQACRIANIPIFLKNNLEPIIENRKLIQEIPC